jgi:cyclase
MRVLAVRLFRAAFVAIGLLLAVSAIAQQPTSAPPPQAGQAQPDMSTTEEKVTKLSGNVYTITAVGPVFYPAPNGRPVGTTAMLAGPDGVLLVDAQFAPLTEKIVAAVKTVSPGPIKTLINTHVHGDHTGGNETFGKMGVTLMAREELKTRLATPGRGGAMPPAASLPTVTYKTQQTINMDGEEVRLIPIMNAHTDGDTVVQFVKADVIMTGDIYRSDNSYPNIDAGNGGSLNGFIEGLNTIAKLAGPNTKIVPGHGTVDNKAAVIAHRDMMVKLRDEVSAMMKAGKTQDEIVAAKLTAEFDKMAKEPMMNGDRVVMQIYGDLNKTK